MSIWEKLHVPNIGDWLSKQNQKTQAQIELLFMMAPFFIAWGVFIYYWVFLLWSEMDSLPIPCIIGSVGYALYFKWRDSIREEATGLDPINMRLRWHEGISEDVCNVIDGWMDLSEEDAYNPGHPELSLIKNCSACGAPVQTIEGLIPSHCGSCGALLPKAKVDRSIIMGSEMFFTKIKFGRNMEDPEGRTWSWAIFIHDFPKDNVFKKIPGQWFTHKGQMFLTATAVIDATYVGFKEEEHHVKYFRITSDPERTRLIQIGIGITPANANVDAINKARDLSSIRVGLNYIQKFLEANSLLQVYAERFRDAKTKSYKGADRVLDDLDGMRKERKYSTIKTNWKTILFIIILAFVIIWALYSFGIIGGLPQTTSYLPPPQANYSSPG